MLLLPAVVAGALVLPGAEAAARAGAKASDGLLQSSDVGLDVTSKPHTSTVAAIDAVTSDCTPGKETEHEARVVSFAQGAKQPASGARLNQIVYDFPSGGAAKSFFADARVAEQRRAACGTTDKASAIRFRATPKGVGDARFTVTSNEKVSGATQTVVAVEILSGASVTELIFLDWGHGLPSTTTVAKRAVTRLR